MRNAISIKKVELALCDDRRQSLGDIADNTGFDRETISLIVSEDVGATKVSAKVVPKNLTSDQKLTRDLICEDWLENWDNYDKVITRDESCIFKYDLETKRRNMVWKRLEEKCAKKVQ